MAKKKNGDVVVEKRNISTSDLVKELAIEGGFTPLSEIDIMHSRQKTELPILALNCILGGGIPLGVIVEGYGIPASGKSSVFYQSLGNFQKNFPEGLGVIIDTESSVDQQRLKFMGIDCERVLRVPAITLEAGFRTILNVFDKIEKSGSNTPVFFLWDTIAVTITEAQEKGDSDWAAGMAEKARITKRYLSQIMPKLENVNAVIVILNQVMSKLGAFRPTTESGGGFALKHDQHLQLEFKGGKTDLDGIFAVQKNSSVNITKSKLSSLFSEIPVLIDITNAGVVDVEKSFVEYMFNIDVLSAGAWSSAPYLLKRYPEESKKFPMLHKSFRKEDLVEYSRKTPALISLLQVAFIDMISDRYSYQKEVCKAYRDKLYEEVCNFAGDTEVIGEKEEDVEEVMNIEEEIKLVDPALDEALDNYL